MRLALQPTISRSQVERSATEQLRFKKNIRVYKNKNNNIIIHTQVILQNMFADYKYGCISWMNFSVDPDQLASLEVS